MSERKAKGVVIKNLDESTTILHLWEACNKFGKIITQRPGRVHAIVEFDNSDSADKVVGFEELKVASEPRPVFYAKPTQMARKPLIASRKLHVAGVPVEMAIEKLQALLGDCQISLPKNSRDFMFATFADEQSKNRALYELNGKRLDDKHVLKLSPAINTFRFPKEKVNGKK